MINQVLTKNYTTLKEDWDKGADTACFREYIAQGFNEEEAFRLSGEANTKWIREFFNLYNIDWKDKSVTEIGCGAGRMTEFIAKDAKHVYALDISPIMLKRLHQRLGYTNNITTQCIIRDFSVLADLETDIIISFLVFQHTPEDMVERLIQDGRRILKQGGYYFFQMPISSEHKCIPCNDAHALDLVYWTKEEVEELAEKYHYKLICSPEINQSFDSGGQFFIFQKL